jgi:hypothetical protein
MADLSPLRLIHRSQRRCCHRLHKPHRCALLLPRQHCVHVDHHRHCCRHRQGVLCIAAATTSWPLKSFASMPFISNRCAVYRCGQSAAANLCLSIKQLRSKCGCKSISVYQTVVVKLRLQIYVCLSNRCGQSAAANVCLSIKQMWSKCGCKSSR